MEPVAIPGAGITDPPLVCIGVNQLWIPYICGALQQLVQPTAWVAPTPAALAAVQIAAQELVELFGNAPLCSTPSLAQVWVPNAVAGTCSVWTPSGSALGTFTSALFVGPVAVLPVAGVVWIVQDNNHTVARLNVDRSTDGSFLSGNGLHFPFGIAIVNGGNVWVANITVNTISVFTQAGAAVGSAFAVPGVSGSEQTHGIVDVGGKVWVLIEGSPSPAQDRIVQLLPSTASAGSDIFNSALDNPQDAALVGSVVWITNYRSNTLSFHNLDGTLAHSSVVTGAGTGPSGIAYIPPYVWVANNANNTIGLWNPSTYSLVTTLSGNGLSSPFKPGLVGA